MPDVNVQIKLTDGSRLPGYQTPGSAGADVRSVEFSVLKPGEYKLVSTGLFLAVPGGYECQVRPRSGLAFNHGVTVLNSPGTIDSDYRGEIRIMLINMGKEDFTVNPGDRIAQLVFAPVVQVGFDVSDELTKTSRGAGGWGSTGVV